MKNLSLLLLLIFLLAGCSDSGKPSADQIKQLYFSELDYKIFDVKNFTKVDGFLKNDNTYIADISYDLIFKINSNKLPEILGIETHQGIKSLIPVIGLNMLVGKLGGEFEPGDSRKAFIQITLIKKDKGWAIEKIGELQVTIPPDALVQKEKRAADKAKEKAAMEAKTTAIEAKALETKKGKWSYALGVSDARNAMKRGMKVDANLFAQGVMDVFSDKKRKDQEKESYSFGYTVAEKTKMKWAEVDLNLLAKGFKDELAGKPRLTEAEISAAKQEISVAMKEMDDQLAQKRVVLGEDNKKAGEAFLEANRNKEGVVTLPSGLQYKILKQGEGKKPATHRLGKG